MEQTSQEISISLPDGKTIQGILTIPSNAKLIVIFAHGSGSGRFSKRNQFVAHHLVEKGMATLLLDLLTREEEIVDEITRELRFNISFLAQRLIDVTNWLSLYPETQSLKMAYFGASTGAAAALLAASQLGEKIVALVSRGGRPDLATPVLAIVYTPTLLIVGGDDLDVIGLNQQAFDLLPGPKKLEIVPHATHLFEEPGTLEKVVWLAISWFQAYSK